jgi:hypothetical protein
MIPVSFSMKDLTSMECVEIEHVYYECEKIKKRVVITYLATTLQPPGPSQPCIPDLTAFDCDFKEKCGVCAREREQVSCCWSRCVHPGLSMQESWTE